MVWGSVLGITLYPLHKMLSAKLRGRNSWSAFIISTLFILTIIGPAVWLMFATVGEFKDLGTAYREGELRIPPPSESVKDWPLVGSSLYSTWSEASNNLSDLISRHREQVKSVLLTLFSLMKNTGKGILLFTLSIIASGILLANAKAAGSFAQAFLVRLVGPRGKNLAESAEATVRNVAKGVLGVAIIQSILAGVGFVLADIPFAGLWILICLILAIVQVGILPVSIGVIIYIWGQADTLTATLLTVWMILVGIMDNILKPIMLGKGAPAPMLVVFLGAIGGFILSGFIGLFTGAIILTIGYKMLIVWLEPAREEEIILKGPDAVKKA
jgi:predicted PurR-regulated permease PerM